MRFILSALIFPLAVASANAQITYDIKLKMTAGVGQTTTNKYSDTDSGSAKFLDPQGNLIDEVKPEVAVIELCTTVLAVGPEGRATKFLRSYKKASYSKDGKNLTRSYGGRTLLFEKKDGQYRIGVVGKADLAADDISNLADVVNQKGDWDAIVAWLAPGRPVKVGEEWKLDPKTVLADVTDYKLDPAKSTITAKLTKVLQKEKSQFGIIEVEAKIAAIGAYEVVTFATPAIVEHSGTLEVAIDGSSTERIVKHTEVIRGKGAFETAEKKGTLELDVKSVSTSSTTAEVADPLAIVVPKVEWVTGPEVWIEFASKENGFRVQFPGVPKQDKAGGDPPKLQFLLPTNRDRAAYFVMVTETKGMTAAVMATFAAAETVQKKTEISLNGFSGTEFIQDKKQGETSITIIQRAYVVNDRIIQVMLAHEKSLKVDQKRFFDSFQLLEKPKKDN